ncbi:hypothetical protein BDQ94DRAFT_132471 [Aspergillus welwitschiae]|uniref:Uncharacterized protein n=1 Tax=Aspergillus welwitschiae TaxID=1341132 RepID=A0A3F3QIY4_9EURO|nr:hypothetical protein BDQ94DRAFT_132471 [Aspergillus welwitschiae]RDH39141.1 hypothetical protein BDQ94DRAFT_132471 [Aspergillus welwitschiae]
MRQKSDWLGLALEDGGSPYYKRGRGDRSAIFRIPAGLDCCYSAAERCPVCVRFLSISLGGEVPRGHTGYSSNAPCNAAMQLS